MFIISFRKKALQFVFAFLWVLPHSYAQESLYRSLRTDDGLPSSTVYKSIQDDRGNIWMATDNGICYYDGLGIKTLQIDHINDHFFPFLQKDTFGFFWTSNISNELIQLRGEQANKVTLPDGLRYSRINEFIIHGDKLWISLRKQNKEKVILAYQIEDDGKISVIKSFDIKTTLRTEIYNIADKIYISVPENRTHFELNELTLDSSEVRKILLPEYVTGRFLLHLEEQRFLYYDFNKETIYLTNGLDIQDSIALPLVNVLQKQDEEILALTKNGVYTIEIERGKMNIGKHILKGINVNAMSTCRENLNWISTTHKGVLLLPQKDNISFPLANENGESSIVTTMTPVPNGMLVGTAIGDVFQISENDFEKKYNARDRIRKILPGKDNSIYVGTTFGVEKWDGTKSELISSLPVKDLDFFEGSTFGIASIRSANLWQNGSQKKFKGIPDERSYAIDIFSGSCCWIGTKPGLFIYDLIQDSLLTENPILPYNISDIEIIAEGKGYVSTFSNGLYFVDQNLDRVEKLRSFPDKIKNISFSKEYLCAATDDGVSLLNVKTEELSLINKYNYLPSNDVECVSLDYPYCWIGTNNGVIRIHLSGQKKPDSMAIQFNSILFGDDEIEQLHVGRHSTLERNVQFRYSSVNYNASHKIEYEYRLIGIDNNWQRSDSRKVSYQSLAPGDYRFEVKAFDGMNRQSETLAFPFTLSKNWYETLLFRIVLLTLFGYLVYFFTQAFLSRRLQRLEEKRKNEKKVDGMKMTALQNHMNPHFVSNALYSIQDMIEKEQNWEAGEYTSLFADLIRRSMRYTTTERISLHQEIEFLKVYIELESIRKNDSIDVSFIVDPQLEKEKRSIMIPPLLIQPVIENAFKHAFNSDIKEPKLEIDISNLDQAIKVRVQDNGIGFKTNSKDTSSSKMSTGLETVRERLFLNSKQLQRNHSALLLERKENDHQALGTTITLIIDYDK